MSGSPQVDETVQIRFSRRGHGPFWQTNVTIAAVTSGTVVLDGFDRPVSAEVSELKRFGPGRWTLDWEIRGRP
ncbi:hypothetical protein [Brevundimonas sp.]|uniref:hypothetical protein n=1 Tax=Brevundimonas sp. TaxID=1871086 RepID=UPI0019A03C9E|nr:hypothetical protein [Brevundimonas sp.]MBD3837911.1 hypothetical protein [Brevundimonas sp.]